MAIPSYGAAPLSATFLGVRVLQVVCLIVILGMVCICFSVTYPTSGLTYPIRLATSSMKWS
jgi:hypothetical protein